MTMFSRAAAFTPARPEEILRQVNPWFILLTFLLGLLANIAPANAVALALKPDFLALVILYWCIQEPRYVGVGVAWALGLVMDVADAASTRSRTRRSRTPRSISAGACCASRCGSRRRRWRCCCFSAPR
jgi:hypothetical protein